MFYINNITIYFILFPNRNFISRIYICLKKKVFLQVKHNINEMVKNTLIHSLHLIAFLKDLLRNKCNLLH